MYWIIRVKFKVGMFYCDDKGRPTSEINKAHRWNNKFDAEYAMERWKPWFGKEAKVKLIKINKTIS